MEGMGRRSARIWVHLIQKNDDLIGLPYQGEEGKTFPIMADCSDVEATSYSKQLLLTIN